MKIVVATKNRGKLKEIEKILKDDRFQICSQDDVGIYADVNETGTTFEENALIKACEIGKLSGEITIADDSGLVVDALDGLPGIFSARYAAEDHREEFKDDEKNIDKLLLDMEGIKEGERTARFVSAIACYFPSGESFVVRGECEGSITRERRGQGGFGYDPIFLYDRLSVTFGEMSDEIKNEISHRKVALKKFQKIFKSYLELGEIK